MCDGMNSIYGRSRIALTFARRSVLVRVGVAARARMLVAYPVIVGVASATARLNLRGESPVWLVS
jgi:hypothetical protein